MSNLPTVSVILTSYNHEKFIPDAIKGILAQDYTDFELIIIDDKSKDASLEVIEKFKDGQYKDGLIKGILEAGEQLKKYFPYNHEGDMDELSNEISRG